MLNNNSSILPKAKMAILYVVKSSFSYGKRDVVGSNSLGTKIFSNEARAIEYMEFLVKKEGINGKRDLNRCTCFASEEYSSDFGNAGEGYFSSREKWGLAKMEKVIFGDDLEAEDWPEKHR